MQCPIVLCRCVKHSHDIQCARTMCNVQCASLVQIGAWGRTLAPAIAVYTQTIWTRDALTTAGESIPTNTQRHGMVWYGLVKCRFIICSSTSASGPETLSLLERALFCWKKQCVSQGGVWRQETLLEHSARKRTVHCVSEKEVQLYIRPHTDMVWYSMVLCRFIIFSSTAAKATVKCFTPIAAFI